ncbi:hypothetical protein [Planococcus donghaensis]|uniref:hypothetical protein n=1 Tax=Planococcus donghaensis TaxID=414778 RepID=UPI003736B2B5
MWLKNATSPARLMPVESTRALALIFIVQLQQPAPRVASAFPAMAEERHYRQGFQRWSEVRRMRIM